MSDFFATVLAKTVAMLVEELAVRLARLVFTAFVRPHLAVA
ncbi:MAG TPA: hypothetical protein VIL00_15915 [Pseudonocardiaceae bacterium]